MSCTKNDYMRVMYDACQVMFDWNEYGCRDLSRMYDEDYTYAMEAHEPYNTPANLATSLMIDNTLYDDYFARRTIGDVAIATMRNILEYAQEENDAWCYDEEEQLDAFDKMAAFVSLLGAMA